MTSVDGGLDDHKVVYAGSAAAANYQGLWWNPAESGWGINLAHQGDAVYLTWYTYDAAGKASWLAMYATKTAAASYAGDIVEVHGSPYDVVPYDPSRKLVAVVGSGFVGFAIGRDLGLHASAATTKTSAAIRTPMRSPLSSG